MLVIEPMAPEDAGEVAALAEVALDEPLHGPATCWVARDIASNHIVGFAAGRREEPCEGHILGLAVEPRFRRTGIGSRLLHDLGRDLAQNGAFHLSLEVRPEDPAARSFYTRNGFAPEGLAPQAYADGGDALRLGRIV